MNRKLTAALLITAAVLTNVAFTMLGSIFNYPDVLKEPAESVLTAFRASQGSVSLWFTVMALAAALFAPIAIGVGKLSTRRAMRVAVPIGIVAAVVQVMGLMRWPLLVPGYAADAASADPAIAEGGRDSFTTANLVLGNIIGETFGYILTAAWTVLVLAALRRTLAGRWFTALGVVSAALIFAGVLSPLDLPVIDTANFIGYVLWSLWLIAFAILLLRRPAPPTSTPEPSTAALNTPCAPDRALAARNTAGALVRTQPAPTGVTHRRIGSPVLELDFTHQGGIAPARAAGILGGNRSSGHRRGRYLDGYQISLEVVEHAVGETGTHAADEVQRTVRCVHT